MLCTLLLIFFGMRIPFPLGNSPGSCRGIFLQLSPLPYYFPEYENCYINTSSGHLYPLWGKRQGPSGQSYCISCIPQAKRCHSLWFIFKLLSSCCLYFFYPVWHSFSRVLQFFQVNIVFGGLFSTRPVLFLRLLPCCESHLSVTLSSCYTKWCSRNNLFSVTIFKTFKKLYLYYFFHLVCSRVTMVTT